MNVPHISPTSTNQFQRCEAQWVYRKVLGIKKPPGAALTMGKCYDRGCQGQFYSRMDDEKDLPVDDVLGRFEEEWDKEKDGTDWQDDDEGAVKDTGMGCLTAYYEDGMLDIIPTSVQEEVIIPFEDETLPNILGYVDVVHDSTVIIDQKTAGRKQSNMNADHRTQMTIYKLAMEALHGREFSTRVDYAIKTKKPYIQLIDVEIAQADCDFQLRQIARVAQRMAYLADETNRHLAIPNRNHMLCSERWCGYWTECHQDY